MRKILLAVLVVAAVVSSAFAAEAKTLVVIFSRADENYGVGYVEVGNTMKLAQMIAQKTGAELFEVAPAKKYPADYDTCIDVAKKEQNRNDRPAIAQDKDISEYDTIFFGYPVWWGDIPMCMYTFVEAHDWAGKRVIPFCTHEGSGSGRTDGTLKRLMKGAELSRAMAVRGAAAQKGGADVEHTVDNWLKSAGF
ncbi:MAG: NAD(P)H-dependent oxidoreductase [Synergistaceae bacterium]|nr:NAD(P)H-dependent oxidoreductase [Synergistaceae bacterium]